MLRKLSCINVSVIIFKILSKIVPVIFLMTVAAMVMALVVMIFWFIALFHSLDVQSPNNGT